MNIAAVQNIYDTLFTTESKLKKQQTYPIHKRLNAERLQYTDIYEWLSAELNFMENASVLDAGCGVGYGSLLLAKQHSISITGISLSKLEVEQASQVTIHQNLTDKAQFELKSFDEVPPNSFDLIIAVESVKHSFQLAHTLTVLKAALKEHGKLVIVEDFYKKNTPSTAAKNYISDWHLVDAFRLEDYHQTLPPAQCTLTDLTSSMFPKRKWNIQLKLALANILHATQRTEKAALSQIFRGGFYLDQLYAEGLMTYQVLTYQK